MADRFGIGVALALGIVVRAAPVITAGGVVGDGGLILALVDDIRAAGLSLPAGASYNDLGIPFVYPPLALWAAAALGDLLGIGTLDLLTWLPMTLSVLALAAFAWLSWRLLPPVAAVGATFAFALMPSAYGWLVAAGGLTRGTGLLFALLAAAVVASRPPSASGRRALAVGLLLGLAGLSHPQAFVFGVLACVLLTPREALGPSLRMIAIAGGTAIVVLLPWLAWVAANGEIGALFSAGQRLEPLIGLIRLLNLRFTGAWFMDLASVAGLLGLVVAVLRRQWRVPALLLLVSLVGAGGGEFLAAVPWALLAGTGVAAIVDLARHAMVEVPAGAGRALGLSTGLTALFLTLIGALGSFTDSSSKLYPIGADAIAAMRWLSRETPADAVVVVPTNEVWGYDELSEWLPALANRRSLGTVQGSEWLGAEGFGAQLSAHAAILRCAGSTADCYRELAPMAVLFVPKGSIAGPFSPPDCCPAVRATLADAGYEIVYDGPGATIGIPGH